MTTARYLIGDVFERLAQIPDGSVDMVMTSPPFLALRSYLPPDHPDKHKEIGSEPTPAEFIDTMLALTAEWRRVLAPHGSIVVELGDTYSGSGNGPDASKVGRDGSHDLANDENVPRRGGAGWPLPKSMVGIPHLYHLSLAYGRNLLTGAESPAGDWRVRNVVAWCRPNPPVGALGDKFRPATSYLTIATVSPKRYFDLDAVRVPGASFDRAEGTSRGKSIHGKPEGWTADAPLKHNPAGAPPLDWWEIPTQPYSGSHYAVYPPALCVRPIKAMCPIKVCTVCGEPSRRIVGDPEYVPSATHRGGAMMADTERVADGVNQWTGDGGARASVVRQSETIGWTDCQCSTDGSHWRNGVVLDPFGGSGTTGLVATGLGRDAILIDIDERNADLARDRIGMFLTVEEGTP